MRSFGPHQLAGLRARWPAPLGAGVSTAISARSGWVAISRPLASKVRPLAPFEFSRKVVRFPSAAIFVISVGGLLGEDERTVRRLDRPLGAAQVPGDQLDTGASGHHPGNRRRRRFGWRRIRGGIRCRRGGRWRLGVASRRAEAERASRVKRRDMAFLTMKATDRCHGCNPSAKQTSSRYGWSGHASIGIQELLRR